MAADNNDDGNGNQPPTTWSSLTDEQLQDVSFDFDNPEDLERLVWELPRTDEVPGIEGRYTTKGGNAAYVYCIHCGHKTHNRGLVMLYSDGSRILVGRDCAKTHWKADFDAVEKDFDEAMKRAVLLRRRSATLTNRVPLKSTLDGLLAHPSLQQFRDLKKQVHDRAPDLNQQLGNVCAA